MWHRDAALVAIRQQDIEREVRAAAVLTATREDGRSARPATAATAVRSRSAAGIRRLGEAVIGLSQRIDVPECDGPGYCPDRRTAAS
jgi:hypothetical protein